VREYNEDLEVENEFLTDVFQSGAAMWKRGVRGWVRRTNRTQVHHTNTVD
jgi:hypothetical protein